MVTQSDQQNHERPGDDTNDHDQEQSATVSARDAFGFLGAVSQFAGATELGLAGVVVRKEFKAVSDPVSQLKQLGAAQAWGLARALGRGIGFGGIVFDYHQVMTEVMHPTEASANTVFTLAGVYGGPFGALASGTYFIGKPLQAQYNKRLIQRVEEGHPFPYYLPGTVQISVST